MATMTEAATITANIIARQEAEEIVAFIGEKPQRFWEILAQHAASQLPPKPAEHKPEPMSDDEAKRFEEMLLPYGKHARKPVHEAPCSYLLFLSEGDEFTHQLRRYTASRYFAKRQDEET